MSDNIACANHMTHTSPTDPSQTAAEIAQLHETLVATEAELLRLREHRSLEMARLERQVYWLDRWGVDLDIWMQRRAVRAVFGALRLVRRLSRRLRTRSE